MQPFAPFLRRSEAQRRRLSRRALAGFALAALAAAACGVKFLPTGKKLVVIGIDGMDPNLLRQYMDAGKMPHFKALADAGTFVPLGTSNPPQSPVAWSNFITGMDPGGHGVYDFLHRDPATYAPISSTQITTGEPLEFPLPGNMRIEIPADTEPVRKGAAFWDLLADRGVRADVYRIPAAYPIQPSPQRTLSDMGTPDLQGGIDGTYAYYTTDPPDNVARIQGGIYRLLKVVNERTTNAVLFGPPSPYRRPEPGKHDVPKSETPFTVSIDPSEPVVLVEIDGGDSCVLREGEWSPWLRCSFDLGLMQSMNGMCKFFLQQVRPELRLYCSPINIDPREPCMPISTPDDEAVTEMCEAIGPFYTQGLAEETKALQEGTISDGEFLVQCDDINAERLRMLDYALDRFDDGLLFFYFSAVDLRCHMMWRHIEPGHPARDEKLAAQFAGSIEDAYLQMDRALGHIREKAGRSTELIVLSDHGFSPFVRNVDLNEWLVEQGWLVPSEAKLAAHRAEVEAYRRKVASLSPEEARRVARPSLALALARPEDFDRAKTRAYAIGFNSIYLNLEGREAGGCVKPSEAPALLAQIRAGLLALRDEQRGGVPVVRRADLRDEVYHGDQLDHAPDLVVGYDRGYGASDETALGELTLGPASSVLNDNKSLWSGNHLMAPEVVPGVLLCSRKLQPKDPSLVDLTATMLRFFGVEPPATMRGRSLFD